MDKLTASFLQTHPDLQPWLGGLVLLLLGASMLLAAGVVTRWRAGQWTGNQLPVVPLDLSQLAMFLVTLAALMTGLSYTEFSRVSFHLASVMAVMITWGALRVDWRRQLGWSRANAAQVLYGGAGLVFGLYLPLHILALVGVVGWQFLGLPVEDQAAVEWFLRAKTVEQKTGLLLFAVVLAPVAEELLFRGFLQPVLKNWMSGGMALILTALVFAAIHFHGPFFLPLFALGVVLGLVYEYTGAWWRCVAVHACFNAVTAGFLLFLKEFS